MPYSYGYESDGRQYIYNDADKSKEYTGNNINNTPKTESPPANAKYIGDPGSGSATLEGSDKYGQYRQDLHTGQKYYYPTKIEGGSMSESASSAESMDDILSAFLKYNPEFAEQNWDILNKYAPKEAELGFTLADLYSPKYQALAEQLRSSDRSADFADLLKWAPSLQGVREAGELPEVTAIRRELMNQTLSDLMLGESLSGDQRRSVEQSLRTAEGARGMSGGRGSANREAVTKALEGLALKQRRQATAQSVLGQEYGAQPDPYLAILGRPASAMTAGMQERGTSSPSSSVAASVGNTSDYAGNYWNAANYNAGQQAYNLQLAIAKANPDLKGFSL